MFYFFFSFCWFFVFLYIHAECARMIFFFKVDPRHSSSQQAKDDKQVYSLSANNHSQVRDTRYINHIKARRVSQQSTNNSIHWAREKKVVMLNITGYLLWYDMGNEYTIHLIFFFFFLGKKKHASITYGKRKENKYGENYRPNGMLVDLVRSEKESFSDCFWQYSFQ